MKSKSNFAKLEELIVKDPKLLFTITAFIMVAAIYNNLSANASALIGITATSIYFMINAVFLGRAFFGEESLFSRFALGSLLLIVSLGLIAWAIMIIHNLDIFRSAVALSIVVAMCSFSSKRVKHKNGE